MSGLAGRPKRSHYAAIHRPYQREHEVRRRGRCCDCDLDNQADTCSKASVEVTASKQRAKPSTFKGESSKHHSAGSLEDTNLINISNISGMDLFHLSVT